MIGLVIAVLVIFATELIAIDLVALGIPVVLMLADALTPMELISFEQAVAGFGNPAVVTIAMMFVLSVGLMRTGAVNFLGARILQISRGNAHLSIACTMVAVATLSAFINNTPIVVIFLPIVLNLARQFSISPSKLLIPLSFASIFGGTCTLIGTSTNLVVDSMMPTNGLEEIGMFELLPMGLVFAGVGVIYLLAGKGLLPSRTTVTSYTGGDQLREYVTEVEVGPGSRLLGCRIADTFLGEDRGVRVLEVIRGEEILWPPLDDVLLAEGDLLLVKGDVNKLLDLDGREGLALIPELASGDLRVSTRETTLAELVVSPNSRLIGQRVRDVKFHQIFDVAVIAVQRRGVHLRRKVSQLVLRFGDTLLVQGSVEALQGLRESPDFILLEGVEETVLRPRKAPIAFGILLSIVVLAGFNVLHILPLSMAGAFLMVVTGCVSLREAYRAIDLRVVMVIAGTLALGSAMTETGTAQAIVESFQGAIAPLGAVGALSGVYFLTMVLTSVISNTAAAVLMVPLAISVAGTVGATDPRPFVIAVAFGASACFATPLGYQTNLFVYGPGGYRFSDFLRIGVPLNLLFWILATIFIPVFWPIR